MTDAQKQHKRIKRSWPRIYHHCIQIGTYQGCVLTAEHTALQENDLPLMFNKNWMRISAKPARDFSDMHLIREKSYAQIVFAWIGGILIEIK